MHTEKRRINSFKSIHFIIISFGEILMLSVCECGVNLNNDLWTANIIRINGKVLQIGNQAAIIWLLLLLLYGNNIPSSIHRS